MEGPRSSVTYDKRSNALRSLIDEYNLCSVHLQRGANDQVFTFQGMVDQKQRKAIFLLVVKIYMKCGIFMYHMVSDHKPIRCTFMVLSNDEFATVDVGKKSSLMDLDLDQT